MARELERGRELAAHPPAADDDDVHPVSRFSQWL